MTTICRLGYHEENAQSADCLKAARTRSPGVLGICGGWLFLFRELGTPIIILGDLESNVAARFVIM